MKSPESSAHPLCRKLWGLQFHLEITTSQKKIRDMKINQDPRMLGLRGPQPSSPLLPKPEILQNVLENFKKQAASPTSRPMKSTPGGVPWNLYCSEAPPGDPDPAICGEEAVISPTPFIFSFLGTKGRQVYPKGKNLTQSHTEKLFSSDAYLKYP